MRSWKFLLPLLASSLCFAAQPDRITAPIDSSQRVPLKGNIHGLAQARFDLGRTDSGQMIHGLTLVFHPSAAQQAALDTLLAQQQQRSSPNYHKWLTPAQFADRFGMTQADIARVTSWLDSQGFTVTSVANSRNQIAFDGTVAQVESVFATEIHNYLVDGVIHFANATNPSVPAALAASVLSVGHLHNFSPKPRSIVRRPPSEGADPHFTSVVTGNHFLSPADFATIYDLGPLYTAGMDGTGQSIAIIGQSTVAATDLSNFRSAAGLAAKVPQYVLFPSTSTATRCSGDEGESDLDLEWSGGVAKSANIIFVYAGLLTGDTCANRSNSVWDALQDAVDTNIAPVISTSYGFCESGLGLSFATTVRGWAQQANSQGQTIMAASGDSGAADCDPNNTDPNDTSATGGFAVDVPASIPEVTGMGGSEFMGDAEGGAPVNGNIAATQYWSGTTGGVDTLSSALSYIPEEGWNDTTLNLANGGTIGASGGGASIYFTKVVGEASWQTGPGVPNDGKRDVPDLAMNASPDHDGYLFCSEDGPNNTIVATCTSGFRTGSGGTLAVVGGTSAAAPTFSAVLALVEESLSLTGLGNINPRLYQLAAGTPSPFHDITTGNNIVPCTNPSTDCPTTAPFQYGFSAGVGYDQVTGLGSVDANALSQAWIPPFQLTATPSAASVVAGQSVSTTIAVTPTNSSPGMTVNFSNTSCAGLPGGGTCTFNPTSVNGASAQNVTLTIFIPANIAAGSLPIVVTGNASGTSTGSETTSVSLAVSATTETFTIATTSATVPVTAGGTAKVPITVTGTNGFIVSGSSTTALPLSYTCTGFPAESTCTFSPSSGSMVSATSLTMSIATTPPTGELRPIMGRGSRIFYALLLPGMFGIVFAGGSRTRAARLLGLIVVLSFSTLWMGACGGGSSSQKNPGTPAGSYTVTVNATTGGTNPLTSTFNVTLTVTN